METSSSVDPDALTNSPNSRRNQFQFSTLTFLRSPVSTLLEYSGILRPRSDHLDAEGLLSSTGDDSHSPLRRRLSDAGAQTSSSSTINSGEVSIRIIGADDGEGASAIASAGGDGGEDRVRVSSPSSGGSAGGDGSEGAGGGDSGNSGNSRDTSPYQRYDIQQVARWVEQVLPFSLLLLVVFIRQHLQGSNLFGFDLRFVISCNCLL